MAKLDGLEAVLDFLNPDEDLVEVILVDKRNDDEVFDTPGLKTRGFLRTNLGDESAQISVLKG